MQYKLASVNAKKKVYCMRVCLLCQKKYRAVGTQKWCSECVPDYVARRRAQRYGISQVEWNDRFLSQEGKCALCLNIPTVVDHCHVHGHVRGLLCNACNFLIGAIDKPNFIKKAIDYIEDAKYADEISKAKSMDACEQAGNGQPMGKRNAQRRKAARFREKEKDVKLPKDFGKVV